MNRTVSILAVAALLAIAMTAVADQSGTKPAAKAAAATAAAPKTISGEVVDMGCYLGHGARGEKHVSCATKCISNGMPMGLLTSSGTLYLLTLDHENADPYNSLKTMAGQEVSVTGPVVTRNGVKGIDVTAVQAASK